MNIKVFRNNVTCRLQRTWYGQYLFCLLKYINSRDPFHKKLKISNHGSLLLKRKEINGRNNTMCIGSHSLLNHVVLKVSGNNNKIIIGNNCTIGPNCKIYIFGNNLELIVGDYTTFTHDVELLVHEDESKIIIGKDCMFSHHINVRTSDGHSLCDLESQQRTNKAKNVVIGDHVWITPNCIIQKGCIIGSGAVIATNSIVLHDVPNNSIVGGMPAQVLKENVYWCRELK